VRHRITPQPDGEQRVAPVVPAEQAQQPPGTMAQIHARLDPALQRLLEPPNQNPRRAPTRARAPGPQRPRRHQANPPGTIPRVTIRRRRRP
jgi:hypothetical protein